MTFAPQYHIKDIFNSSYVTTREAAQEIVERAPDNAKFDFSGIVFASSSFVDEFLSLLPESKDITELATNLNPELRRLFQAVLKRRGMRMRA